MPRNTFEEIKASYETALSEGQSVGIYEKGNELLERFPSKLTNYEADDIKAAIFQSTVQLKDQKSMISLWKEFDSKYSNSGKVDRLAVMGLFAQAASKAAGLKQASRVLAARVLSDPGNMADRRTGLSLLRSGLSSPNEYVKCLHEHLNELPTDAVAWKSLGETYLRLGRRLEARVCYEELALVLDTQNFVNLIALAEICFSMRSYVVAFKYWSLAVTFEPYSVRALWGVVATFTALKKNVELYGLELIEKYRPVAVAAAENLRDFLELRKEHNDLSHSIFINAQLDLANECCKSMND